MLHYYWNRTDDSHNTDTVHQVEHSTYSTVRIYGATLAVRTTSICLYEYVGLLSAARSTIRQSLRRPAPSFFLTNMSKEQESNGHTISPSVHPIRVDMTIHIFQSVGGSG